MTPINRVNGIGLALERSLAAKGITTTEALATATPERLQTVPRVGLRRAEQLIAAAQALMALTGATLQPANGVPVAKDAPAATPVADPEKPKTSGGTKPAKAATAKVGKAAKKKAKPDKKKDKKGKGKAKKDKKKKADKKASRKGKKAKAKSGKSKSKKK